MGLFDMFKSDSGDKLSPHLAFAISLLYMISADGEIDNEEVGHLLSVLGGKSEGGTIGVGAQNRALLDAAQRYCNSHSIDDFVREASPILSDAQKICILTNLVDSSLSDGQPEQEEQVLFDKFLRGFGIPEKRFAPFFEVIAVKSDRSVFTNKNHPSNAPGFQVKLSV